MTTEKKGCLAFAVCGSFCTLEDALGAPQALPLLPSSLQSLSSSKL